MDEPYQYSQAESRNGKWQVHLHIDAEKELKDPKKYPPDVRKRLSEALDSLEDNPYSRGSTQLNMNKAIRRIKTGKYRITYSLDIDSKTILVTEITKRADTYKKH